MSIKNTVSGTVYRLNIPMGGYKKPVFEKVVRIKMEESLRKIAALGPKRSRWAR